MAPLILALELQAGAWLRRGTFDGLTSEAVCGTDVWTYGADLLAGSVLVGCMAGAAMVAARDAAGRGRDQNPAFRELVRCAADRYLAASVTAWEFARGKLRSDPVYRTIVAGGLLRSGGTLIDMGCGQGLALAVLAEGARMWSDGLWPPSLSPPPLFDRLLGVERRPRVAVIAQRALGAAATIVEGDIRETVPEPCRAVLLFDMLHMMGPVDQQQVLRAVAEALEPGGAVLVREADRGGGWRFQVVRAGNRLKALAFGNWKQRFHFRRASEWQTDFEALGFEVERHPGGTSALLGNVLFVLRRPEKRI